MLAAETMDRCRGWIFVFLRWRVRTGVWQKFLVMGGMTCAMGFLARIRLPLPFTPVPVTGQVFGVLLSGVLLGAGWAPLSQVLYVALGAAGVPWFATEAGLFGPTSGYLVGFVAAAALVGCLTERLPRGHCFPVQIAIMGAGIAVIYFFGALGFRLFVRTDLATTWRMAIQPFIGIDLVKALLAATLSSAILPRKPCR